METQSNRRCKYCGEKLYGEWVKGFGNCFWCALKQAYNQAFKNIPKENTQDFRDTKHINFLAIFVSKLTNLANTEATFDIESDSTQTERLKELCKDLEAKRFDITSDILADGDLWVFPATDGSIMNALKARIKKVKNGEGRLICLKNAEEYIFRTTSRGLYILYA